MSALMSIESDFLILNCVQELPVPRDELSTTKESNSVEDQVMETNPKAAVRGLILNLPSL